VKSGAARLLELGDTKLLLTVLAVLGVLAVVPKPVRVAALTVLGVLAVAAVAGLAVFKPEMLGVSASDFRVKSSKLVPKVLSSPVEGIVLAVVVVTAPGATVAIGKA
jgi:hypothetical protein